MKWTFAKVDSINRIYVIAVFNNNNKQVVKVI